MFQQNCYDLGFWSFLGLGRSDFEIESKYNLNRFLVLFIGLYLGFARCYFSELFSSYRWCILLILLSLL